MAKKKSIGHSIFEVKPDPDDSVTVVGDLAIIKVKINQTVTAPSLMEMQRGYTQRGLEKLSKFMEQGWVMIANSTYADSRYMVMVYTLQKPK